MSKKYRIEFDDISEVPEVYVDGKRVDSLETGGLVALKIDWETNTSKVKPGFFGLDYWDGKKKRESQLNQVRQTVDGDEDDVVDDESNDEAGEKLTDILNRFLNDDD
ncbi:hypothetical protein PQ472_07820 [Lacticaseibacillus pabuli]|uniref:Uncharacterized protein n=1 Tax=Lacticaseibacillus pabuli TaxID=3025672 RepID=A0ABY7WS70_9LACO|nr:hypothetical protein [Lacticaseibacillus sp. KACC 23028]WDF81832.1 hypothetical protein PQ472_07820 [Lacticaseibacillus sp. KACC 23028]